MFIETDAALGVLLAFLAANLALASVINLNSSTTLAFSLQDKQCKADLIADKIVNNFGNAGKEAILLSAEQFAVGDSHITVFDSSFGVDPPEDSFFVSRRLVFSSGNSSILEVIIW